MKIKALSEKTGTPPSTLRYYESIGLLPKTTRRSGQRIYSEAVVWRVNFVNAAKSVGFSLDEVKSLFDLSDNNEDWREVANQKLNEIELEIQRLQKMHSALSHVVQHDCLDAGIAQFAQKPELSFS